MARKPIANSEEEVAAIGKVLNAPLYYAIRDSVFKRPVEHKRPDGFTDIAMGFKICEAWPGVEAKDIAKKFNFAEEAEALLRDGPGSLDDAPIFKAAVAKLLKEFG